LTAATCGNGIVETRRIEMRLRRLLLFALVVAGVAAPAASAHLLYTSGLYTKDPLCVGGTSAIAEGPPQAMADVYTQSVDPLHAICLTAKNMPVGYLALKRQIWRWNGSAWKLCAGSGWIYNSSKTSYMQSFRQWKSGMPCGAGWYNNLGYGYAYVNGIWYGGNRWSGNHYFS
jgi:hypothetical protein